MNNNKEKTNKKLKNKNSKIIKKINSIIFHSICNLIICLILIAFTSTQINKITNLIGISKKIYIVLTYIGVISITMLGAFLSVKIEQRIRNNKNSTQSKENILSKNNTQNQTLNRELKKMCDENTLNDNAPSVIKQYEGNFLEKPYTRIRKRKDIS